MHEVEAATRETARVCRDRDGYKAVTDGGGGGERRRRVATRARLNLARL